MSDRTDRWGLSTLGPGDSIPDDGYKFSDADIRKIDRLLSYLVEQHHHTGEPGNDATPGAGPTLTLYTSGGAIAAGSRFFYRISVVDADGNESAASPISHMDAPTPVLEPDAPALSYLTGSGTLEPGQYTYVLTAYKGATTLETKALNSAVIQVLGTSTTNEIDLIMPALPAGADGFNIYRKEPNGFHFLYLDSTASASYSDDGSVEPDCDRTIPGENTTNNTNYIEVMYPGATPALAEGFSWRIYRTDDPSDWNNSYLTEVVPIGATPTTPISYDDVGESTMVGAPPEVGDIIDAPDKIVLTDAEEVQGTLPPGRNVVPYVVSFTQPGLVTVGPGRFIWTCDFDQADIQYARAYLGYGYYPSVDEVIVNVLAYRPSQAILTWDSIFNDVLANMPTIAVGELISPESATPDIIHLERGDALMVQVEQAGGGATPTDEDLTVNLLLLVQQGSTSDSYVWSTT